MRSRTPQTQDEAESWILEFVEFQALCRGVAPSTIGGHLSAVAHGWLVSGVNFVVFTKRVKVALKGAERIWVEDGRRGARRSPFTAALVGISWRIAERVCGEDHTAVFAALSLGYFFLLRSSEYLPEGGRARARAIHVCDVSLWRGDCEVRLGNIFGSNWSCEEPPSALSVRVPFSKTDQGGSGEVRRRVACHSEICVVAAMMRYALKYDLRGCDELPIFHRARIRPTQLRDLIRAAARAAGLDENLFNVHSLRIGGLSQLVNAGVANQLALHAGRWRSSDMLTTYFRPSQHGDQLISTALASGGREMGHGG